MTGQWRASWISLSASPHEDLGGFKFRCDFSLEVVPEKLVVRATADQRYKLYCNGSLVTFGPQRGDAQHWFYEVLDLAPFLVSGVNLIEALVWNFGRWAPMAQCTVRTGFVLEAPIGFDALSTPGDWQVGRVPGWDFDMMHSSVGDFYIDVGPGEIIDDTRLVPEFDSPYVICRAEERGTSGGGTPWMLIPRSIPLMRYEHREKMPVLRRGDLALSPGESVLTDFEEVLCAYPRLSVEGPCRLTLTYAESLWNADGTKGNRDEVDDKEIRGYQDVFIAGVEGGVFEPLWWRTFRYVLIESVEDFAENREQARKIRVSLEAFETGYPLAVESSFTADEPWVEKIWDVAVRTAESCAGETYFDCPYYEQLQYVGDTRIQALIGYYLGRDRALQRNAVETLGWSIMENGLTQSRYPSRQTQVIPPFSLWWVMMVWDQMMYDSASELVADKKYVRWRQAQSIVEAYSRIIDHDPEYWLFADWFNSWKAGIPPGGPYAPVHLLTQALAQFVSAHLIESHVIEPYESWFHWENGLINDVAGLGAPSEHAEALWRVLQTLVDRCSEPDPWPIEALEKVNAAKCTYYFQYYKHLAMFGRADAPFDYMHELQPWKEMIEDGLTTFAENPEPTRSDCHAWSAHPILGFFQIVAGVTSISPAWKKARIMPHPGSLKRFDARIAHPDGELRVAYEHEKLTIDSPVPFEFLWREMKQEFEPGSHLISG